jgi:Spy/CpxP family protein refolding chaperone
MKLSLVLVAVLGLLPLAQAQTEHTPPSPAKIAQHQVQHYTTLLSLNSSQVEQATSIFNAEAATHSSTWASEKAAHQALEAAIKAGDKETIQSTAAKLGQISGEALASHALAEAQFYALLDTDQKTKFGELEKEHMGFGGPGRGPR